MHSLDRRIGAALALVGAAVLWTSRSFPAVPGQKLGAGFLPMLVGLGLVLAGLALVARRRPAAPEAAPPGDERIAAPLVVVLTIVAYLLLADRLGFLIVAPLCLLSAFFALRVRPGPAIAWALLGTLVVHVAFYKFLRVPLPWGVLRPLY